MNKDKWENVTGKLAEKLYFLKIEEDPDQEDEIQVEERSLSSGNISKKDLPEGDLKEKL